MTKSLLSLLAVASLTLLTISCDLDSGSSGNSSLSIEESALQIAENPAAFSGFLWKPHSESTGGLVVLTPYNTHMRTEGQATISGDFGTETAPMRHENHNGNRPHFYFTQHGSTYGNNVTVQVPLNDGSVFSVVVPQGAARYEL
jgi:hypothetical protein